MQLANIFSNFFSSPVVTDTLSETCMACSIAVTDVATVIDTTDSESIVSMLQWKLTRIIGV